MRLPARGFFVLGAVAILLSGAAFADKSKPKAGAAKTGAAKPAAAKPAAAKTGAVLPGGDSGKPINIDATKLDYFDKEQKLIYTGNVVAVQGDSKLKATVLTIFLTPKKAGETQPAQSSTNQMTRMLATGPVTLMQRDQIGTGDNGVYDKTLNTVVLTGNVTLSQGPNVTTGGQLVYDLKTGQAVVTPGAAGTPVHSMFIPSDSSTDPAPAATPAPTRKAKGKSKPKRTDG